MLELRNISAGYGDREILSDICASLPEGSLTAIVGPNGSGKSTLLKAMTGLISHRGEVLFQNRRIDGLPSGERAKLMSYLPQSRTVPEITVEKLVLHGRFPYLTYPRHYREEDVRAAHSAMEQLGIVSLAGRRVSTLSGGERQRAYLAMTLAQGTPVILMDEPTGFLDISHRFETVQLAKELAGQGKTVLAVLHDLDLALRYADRILLLEKGKLLQCAPPEALLESHRLEKVFAIQISRVSSSRGTQYVFFPEECG